jgi:hypothetical protein
MGYPNGTERTCQHPFGLAFCCVGAVSFGGFGEWTMKAKEPTCDQVDYLSKRWKAAPGDQLRPLGDLLRGLPDPAHVVFVGDSLSHQSFEALVCEASKGATTVVMVENSKDPTLCCNNMGATIRFNLTFPGVPGGQERRLTLTLYRDYAPRHHNHVIEERACPEADLLVVNYGLHWNNGDYLNVAGLSYLDDIRNVTLALAKCATQAQAPVIVWRGTSSTHFAGPGGHYAFYRSSPDAPASTQTQAKTADWFDQRLADIDRKDAPYLWEEQELKVRRTRLQNWEGYTRQVSYIGCYPLRHINETREHDFRLPGLLDAAQKQFHVVETTSLPSAVGMPAPSPRGFLTAHEGATVWSPHQPDARVLPTLYYVPWAEFTIDFWRFHKQHRDCSHFCYSPLMYTPLWSELTAVWESANEESSKPNTGVHRSLLDPIESFNLSSRKAQSILH